MSKNIKSIALNEVNEVQISPTANTAPKTGLARLGSYVAKTAAAAATVIGLGGTANAEDPKTTADACTTLEDCFKECPEGTIPNSYRRDNGEIVQYCVEKGASKKLRDEKVTLQLEINNLREELRIREERIKELEKIVSDRDSEILRLKEEELRLRDLLKRCEDKLKSIEDRLKDIGNAPKPSPVVPPVVIKGPTEDQSSIQPFIGVGVQSVAGGPSSNAYTHGLVTLGVTGEGTDGLYGRGALLGGIAALENCGNAPALGLEGGIGFRRGMLGAGVDLQILHTWRPDGLEVEENGFWSVKPRASLRFHPDPLTFEVGVGTSMGQGFNITTLDADAGVTFFANVNGRW